MNTIGKSSLRMLKAPGGNVNQQYNKHNGQNIISMFFFVLINCGNIEAAVRIPAIIPAI